MGLKAFTNEQLEEELELREVIKAAPEPLDVVDFDFDRLDVLRLMAIRYVVGLAEDGYPPKDSDHYMFEQVMEIVYGPEVWEFVNHVLR